MTRVAEPSYSGLKGTPPHFELKLYLLLLLLPMGYSSNSFADAPCASEFPSRSRPLPERLSPLKATLTSAPRPLSQQLELRGVSQFANVGMEKAADLATNALASQWRQAESAASGQISANKKDRDISEDAFWSNKLLHRHQIRQFQRMMQARSETGDQQILGDSVQRRFLMAAAEGEARARKEPTASLPLPRRRRRVMLRPLANTQGPCGQLKKKDSAVERRHAANKNGEPHSRVMEDEPSETTGRRRGASAVRQAQRGRSIHSGTYQRSGHKRRVQKGRKGRGRSTHNAPTSITPDTTSPRTRSPQVINKDHFWLSSKNIQNGEVMKEREDDKNAQRTINLVLITDEIQKSAEKDIQSETESSVSQMLTKKVSGTSVANTDSTGQPLFGGYVKFVMIKADDKTNVTNWAKPKEPYGQVQMAILPVTAFQDFTDSPVCSTKKNRRKFYNLNKKHKAANGKDRNPDYNHVLVYHQAWRDRGHHYPVEVDKNSGLTTPMECSSDNECSSRFAQEDMTSELMTVPEELTAIFNLIPTHSTFWMSSHVEGSDKTRDNSFSTEGISIPSTTVSTLASQTSGNTPKISASGGTSVLSTDAATSGTLSSSVSSTHGWDSTPHTSSVTAEPSTSLDNWMERYTKTSFGSNSLDRSTTASTASGWTAHNVSNLTGEKLKTITQRENTASSQVSISKASRLPSATRRYFTTSHKNLTKTSKQRSTLAGTVNSVPSLRRKFPTFFSSTKIHTEATSKVTKLSQTGSSVRSGPLMTFVATSTKSNRETNSLENDEGEDEERGLRKKMIPTISVSVGKTKSEKILTATGTYHISPSITPLTSKVTVDFPTKSVVVTRDKFTDGVTSKQPTAISTRNYNAILSSTATLAEVLKTLPEMRVEILSEDDDDDDMDRKKRGSDRKLHIPEPVLSKRAVMDDRCARRLGGLARGHWKSIQDEA